MDPLAYWRGQRRRGPPGHHRDPHVEGLSRLLGRTAAPASRHAHRLLRQRRPAQRPGDAAPGRSLVADAITAASRSAPNATPTASPSGYPSPAPAPPMSTATFFAAICPPSAIASGTCASRTPTPSARSRSPAPSAPRPTRDSNPGIAGPPILRCGIIPALGRRVAAGKSPGRPTASFSTPPTRQAVGARWTAPSAGTYAVAATFTDAQSASEQVYVLHGTNLLYQNQTGTPTGSSVTFSADVKIATPGETLDFYSSGVRCTAAHIMIRNPGSGLAWDLGADLSVTNGNPNKLAGPARARPGPTASTSPCRRKNWITI